jgi:hypothetical protein
VRFVETQDFATTIREHVRPFEQFGGLFHDPKIVGTISLRVLRCHASSDAGSLVGNIFQGNVPFRKSAERSAFLPIILPDAITIRNTSC